MYEPDHDSPYEPVHASGLSRDAVSKHAGDFGGHVAGLAAAAMLIGIALAVHAWMTPGFERTMLIMALAGVGVWVLGAFTLHLSAEQAPLLTMLIPTAVFLTVMVAVLALVQFDVPDGIERINQRSADR